MKKKFELPKFSKEIIILLVILLCALFLRTYKSIEGYGYGHDADLYSWIVKDIVVDGHIRLIGQETSTSGIYIGPLYYYMLIPFYLLTNMDPIGVIGFAAALGLLTVFSYYWVFKKLFDPTTGLIAAFVQTFLEIRIGYDRWIVPTILVNIWAIWYLFVVFNLSRGNFSVFFILGILVRLIWHINLALVPILLLVPVAIFFSKKLPSVKNVILGFAGFIIPSVPLILFEIKHGFTQTSAFINSFLLKQENVYGASKFDDVIKQAFGNNLLIPVIILLSGIFLVTRKKLSAKNLILLYLWVISIVAFFTFSSKLISEYYFENIKTVLLCLGILALSFLFKLNYKTKIIAILIMIFISYMGIKFVFSLTGSTDGYLERKAAVEYIYQDAKSHNYPCIAISYITWPGYGLVYRYFFLL